MILNKNKKLFYVVCVFIISKSFLLFVILWKYVSLE